MKKIWFIPVLVGLIVGAAYMGSADGPTDTIIIGADFALSNFGASWGENNLRGAELAVKEINMRGGVLGRPLELKVQDNNSSAAGAVSAARHLLDVDRAQYLLTGWTGEVEAVLPLIDQQKVVTVTVSAGTKDIAAKSEYLFRTWPQDFFAVQQLVKYAKAKKYTRIAILRSSADWEVSLSNSFIEDAQSQGLYIVHSDQFQLGTSADIRSNVQKLKEVNADAIFLPVSDPDVARTVKQIRELGITTPILYPVDISVSSAKDLPPALLTNIIYAVAKPPTANFVTAFKAAYGTSPGVSADTAYDAVYAIAYAIENAGTTSPEIVKSHFVDFDGASGRIVFTKTGDRGQVDILLYNLEDKSLVTVH